MKKNVFTIIFAVIIAVALIVFSGYCLQEYLIYHMIKDVLYSILSLITLTIVVISLVSGGKKHEKN